MPSTEYIAPDPGLGLDTSELDLHARFGGPIAHAGNIRVAVECERHIRRRQPIDHGAGLARLLADIITAPTTRITSWVMPVGGWPYAEFGDRLSSDEAAEADDLRDWTVATDGETVQRVLKSGRVLFAKCNASADGESLNWCVVVAPDYAAWQKYAAVLEPGEIVPTTPAPTMGNLTAEHFEAAHGACDEEEANSRLTWDNDHDGMS